MLIESPQNPKIKNLLKLQQKSRERKSQGIFVVEGVQENNLVLKSGFVPNEIFICESIWENSIDLSAFKIQLVTQKVFEKIAYRNSTGGIIGIYREKKNDLTELKLNENALVVVLESVEKPGNLGAILRTCDGAGVDALVVCDPLVDFYNPNVIRSSVGTVFTNQVVAERKEKTINWLKDNHFQIVSTYLRNDTIDLYEVDFQQKTAIILGTENSGLTEDWIKVSDQLVKIPMKGKVDSLNVSNAAAICIYESLRQRSN